MFIPLWKSAFFWPLLTTDGINFNSFVKHHLILDPYFINFANLSDSVFDGFAKFYSLALSWLKWLEWASKFDEVNPCPADPLHVALYMNDIVTRDQKVGALTSAVRGIRWGHISSGLYSPTENPLVKLVLEGGQRVLAKNTIKNQKDTLSQEIITKIINKVATSENILEIRNVVLILLGFSGVADYFNSL